MTLNNREIILVTYSTERNWSSELPKSKWLCLIVDNDRTRNYIDEVISRIIDNNVCYVCTIGHSCERTHDLVDEELAFREVDVENHYLPNHHIMTTWHTDFDEGVWFACFAAYNENISIDKVVILDMTDGLEKRRIEKLLAEYKVSG